MLLIFPWRRVYLILRLTQLDRDTIYFSITNTNNYAAERENETIRMQIPGEHNKYVPDATTPGGA